MVRGHMAAEGCWRILRIAGMNFENPGKWKSQGLATTESIVIYFHFNWGVPKFLGISTSNSLSNWMICSLELLFAVSNCLALRSDSVASFGTQNRHSLDSLRWFLLVEATCALNHVPFNCDKNSPRKRLFLTWASWSILIHLDPSWFT